MAETKPNEQSHLARGLGISGFQCSQCIWDPFKPLQSLSLQVLWETVLHLECVAESPRGLGIIAGPQAGVRSALGMRICISNNFHNFPSALIQGPSFENCCSDRHRPTDIIQAETSVI